MKEINKLKILIAEDEFPAREYLIKLALSNKSLVLSGICENGQEALDKINTEDFDLVFLDIDLPILSGIEVTEKMQKNPLVVFITAYQNHALKAYEIGAVDYLLKPFSKERFDKAVERSQKFIQEEVKVPDRYKNSILSVKEDYNHYVIPLNEIIYLSSSQKHTIVHTKFKEYEIAKLLGDLEIKLSSSKFIRIHKQYIINIQYISHIQYFMGGSYLAFLKDEENSTLPIGRKYVENVKNTLGIQ